MDKVFSVIKKIIPSPVFKLLQPVYHYGLVFAGSIINRFPSRKLFVIGITGTKGKTTTIEIIASILNEAGYKTALTSTIQFKIGDKSEKNLFKMSMPGRFFMQNFLKRAVLDGCTHAVLEITSEGAKQFRHKFIDLDTLIFTNISPEHIESHGSFEKYLKAKLSIAKSLEKSHKKEKTIISNMDDEHGKDFLNINVDKKIPFSLQDIEIHSTNPISFTYKGEKFSSPLTGEFNVYNILSAIILAKSLNINTESIQKGLDKASVIPGRVEYINVGQDFEVVVDYAHTKDSLEKLYGAFENKEKICVLGNTGGGRDIWKRPEMAQVAEKFCEKIILTNEDPYDEDPNKIISDMVEGMEEKPEIIIDRRSAIAKAITYANKDSIVLITGKGTDPYIMEVGGKKTPWSDKEVAEEEIKKLL